MKEHTVMGDTLVGQPLRRSVIVWAALCAALSQVPAAWADTDSMGAPAANVVVDEDAAGNFYAGDFVRDAGYRRHGQSALRADGKDAAFTFVATLPLSGYYRVYAWWPEGSAKAGAVEYRIGAPSGGSRKARTVRAEQNRGGGDWTWLGTYRFRAGAKVPVTMTSPSGGAVVADAVRFHFQGTVRPAPSIETNALPLATEGEPYRAQLTGIDGRPPFTWREQGTLPLGLVLNARTGTIDGTPERAAERMVFLAARDARGKLATRELELIVLPRAAAGAANPAGRGASTPGSDMLPYSGPGLPSQPYTGPDITSPVTGTPVPPGPGGPDLTNLINLLAAIPEGGWLQANTNEFRDVWTHEDLRPLKGLSNPTPSKIIEAWSSFSWDSNRGDLILYGGGHANYSGNDVYRWRGSTLEWERAALPSEVVRDDLLNFVAIDGPLNAPTSAHTYDNTVFIKHGDRYVTFGGAVHGTGGPYRIQVSPTDDRKTGPYFFDPSLADGDKVGGTTGSHVQRVAPFPEIVGGNMWENRDLWGNPALAGANFPGNFIDSVTGYYDDNGVDVIYVGARSGSTAQDLYRYRIPDINDPSQDTWEKVGRMFDAVNGQGSGAFNPVLNIFVRTSQDEFVYWDMATASQGNVNVVFIPQDVNGPFSANRKGGMDYDPVRDQFALWTGGGEVWVLQAPPTVTTIGWTIELQPTPTTAIPNGDNGTGILGKWKYIPNLDAFMGLQDKGLGNVWIYKPLGWQNPLN